MTLLSILVGLGLEYFLGSLDRIRNFIWFESFSNWLERRCNKFPFWDGPAGVLLTLGIPLLLIAGITNLLAGISAILSFILATAVFVYCVGADFNTLLRTYTEALETGDEGSLQGIEHRLGVDPEAEEQPGAAIIESLLVRAHDHIFAVIFWFIVLGVVGVLLFTLTVRLKAAYTDIHGAFADAVRNLYSVLSWPTSRLLAVGFALAGSLVDALDGWRKVGGNTIDCSEDIIRAGGLGAIQYRLPDSEEVSEQQAEFLAQIQETQTLINRTLIIWLTVLGLMTISGTLH